MGTAWFVCVFEAMRTIVRGGSVSGLTVLWSGGLALFDILLAGWFFTRVYKNAVRTGLIARYSAESAG